MTKSILGYWQDACQLFGKDQRKLFVLVTLNNVKKSFTAQTGLVGMMAAFSIGMFLTLKYGPDASISLWDRVFTLFSLKSFIGIKLLGLTKSQGVGFFAGLLTFSLALLTVMRPSIERKDGKYLLSSLFRYLLFFIVFQELILVLPFFAFQYMDMKNSPLSILKALRGTGYLLLCYLPVVIALLAMYGVLLYCGSLLVHAGVYLGLPAMLSLVILPGLWFVLTMSLFFSACAMYYTKVKHTERQLLFGNQ